MRRKQHHRLASGGGLARLAPLPRLLALALLALSLAGGAMPAPADAAPSKVGKAGKRGETRAPKENPRAKKRAPGVRGMFNAAQALFDAGKYAQALAAYDALLRKYPSYEPAIIQLAKTLYRLDRIKEAYSVFVRVNPQHLDPETSYEYGWSFYTHKAWPGALYAFQRVPKGHALFDLANYYGGICAIRLKRYEEAEEMLDKAVVLPDKLAKSRSLYIKHVQALRLLQQKSALAKERDQARDALSQEDRRRAAAKNEVRDPDKAPPSGYQHQGFHGITKKAELRYELFRQYIDNHGYKETSFDAKITTFEIQSGPMFALPLKASKDRQSAIGLQLRLAAEDRITSGDEQRIIVTENEQDLQRLLAKDLGTTDVVTGIVAASPWIEFPLPEQLWLAVGAEVEFLYPDFKRGKRTGSRKSYAEVNGKVQSATFGGELSYTDFVDEKTKPIYSTVSATVFGKTELIEKLTGKVQVVHAMYDYLNPNIAFDGPDANTRVEAWIAQELPLNSSISLLAAYDNSVNYIFHNIPTYGQLAADGQTMTGQLKLKTTPFPFLEASISQLLTSTAWRSNNDEARQTFEINVPDYIEEFVAMIAVNMAF